MGTIFTLLWGPVHIHQKNKHDSQHHCFSGVLGYPGHAVVGELDFDDTNLPWSMLLLFLPLCLTLWLFLVLADLSVTEVSLSCKPVCQYS